MAPVHPNDGHFYDPVGSQPNHPQRYTYQQSAQPNYPSATPTTYGGTNSAGYQTAQYQNYNEGYGNQQYASGRQDTNTYANANQSTAATALGGIDSQNYVQSNRSAPSNNTFADSSWRGSTYNSNAFGQPTAQAQDRVEPGTSSHHPTQPASTFQRSGVSKLQPQNSGNVYGSDNSRSTVSQTANRTYQQAYAQPATQSAQAQQSQPQRYRSPLHAVQAQQRQQQQVPPQSIHRPSNSPQTGSIDIASTTVDPSQVYDNRAEQQRKAQIEAEKRRKREAGQAARKAEHDRIEAEKQRLEQEAQRREQAAKDAMAAKEAEKAKRNAAAKQAREERRQSKTAADALQQLATSGTTSSAASAQPPPANAEEAEMRAMFQRMREFNSKNPAMLAKLWEEERQTHASQSPQPSQATPSQATPVPAPANSSTPAAASRAALVPAAAPAPPSAPTAQASSTTVPAGGPAGVRPFVFDPDKPIPAWNKASLSLHRDYPGQVLNKIIPGGGKDNPPIWPPQKKGELAEAAAEWLRSRYDNFGKVIHAQTIIEILDGNPSYEQLCEGIERLGLKFERSLLARELLKKVSMAGVSKVRKPPTKKPSAGAANAKKGNTAANAIQIGEASTSSNATPRQPSQTATPRVVNNLGEAVPVQPIPTPGVPTPAASNGQPQPQPHARPPGVEFKRVDSAPKPADKEEAARKRTFGDLVDLTAGDSDDDEPPPPKKIFSPPMGFGNVAPPPPNIHFNKPIGYNDFMRRNLSGPGMIHPPPPPPPQPVPQVPQPPRQKGPSLEQLQTQRMKGVMLVEPIMRDRVARKSTYDIRTIARDVLLATGRHPDMRPLNGHLNPMAKLLGNQGGSFDADGTKGNRSDLSTIRWDIIDPDAPVSTAVGRGLAMKNIALTVSGPATPTLPNAPSGPPPSMVARPPPRATLHTNERGLAVVQYRPPNSQPPPPEAPTSDPRRGRPPRQSVPVNTPPHPTEVMPSVEGSGGAIGYSQFRKTDADGNIIKTKGRPKGWKKSIHSREAQGLTPAKPGSKPATTTRHSASAKPGQKSFEEPEHQIYRCEWIDCTAELHNLDTLKKHVIRIHGRRNIEDMFDCLWSSCKGADPAKDQFLAFEKSEDWLAHVDKEHLQPVAWRLGDGPRGGMLDYRERDPSEASYLSDAYGRSVTPVIRGDSVEPSPDTKRRGGHPAGSLPKTYGGPYIEITGRHEDLKDKKNPLELLRSLEKHKVAVGLTLEQDGCILASEERRVGFIDDEDFEDIIEDATSDDDVYENYRRLYAAEE